MAGKTEPRIAHLEVGKLAACCYIVHAGSGGVSPETNAAPCVVVDPGGDADFIDAAIRRLGLRLDAAFLTHAHADHIGGAEALLALWPGAILACSVETARRAVDPRLNLSVYMGDPVSAPQADRILADGEAFAMAGMPWRAVEVPGHDPGEMVYILGDQAAFTGDVVFAGSIGRSDFPGGDGELLVRGARLLLESLPSDMPLYPGHGPSTTVRRELASNPFLM